jgi:tetratricopeptide (TPR) repeat protein
LPPALGEKSDNALLRLEVSPKVSPRKGAKPLPLEALAKSTATRLIDLLEWYEFPAEGTFTVKAVFQSGDHILTSAALTITLRRPDKKDADWGPVDRLHHLPWSNYITDQFCGDTFDLVKQWPDSKLARYAHYWSGLHHQHKKEYDKAAASFRTVLKRYPDFLLVPDAELGLLECLLAQNKYKEASDHLMSRRVKNCPREAITGHLGGLNYAINQGLFLDAFRKAFEDDF